MRNQQVKEKSVMICVGHLNALRLQSQIKWNLLNFTSVIRL